MSGILLSAVSGLEANQQMLDVVGNNLANSNTTGYKAQTAQFSDLMYQTLQSASGSSSGSLGGVNPVQMGSGVQVASVSTNLQQGTLDQTGNQYDMALQGNGFFVVNNGSQDLYTRAGSFSVNSQGYLVDPSTGDLVQRFGSVGEGSATTPAFQTAGSNNIQIPNGTVIPGQATTNVTLQGNLNPAAAGPLAQVLTSSQPFLSGGAPATTATLLNSLSDNTTPYVPGDNLQITGTTSGGTAVNVTVPIDDTTTLGDVVNAINANFPDATASISSAGNLVVTANNAGPSQLSVAISDVTGNTGATDWGNHTETVTTGGQNGTTVTSSMQVYDAAGSAHTLNLVFQKQANDTWSLTGSFAAGDTSVVSGTVSGISFNPNGSFSAVTGSSYLTVNYANQVAPQQINFNFGTPNGFNGLTQVGGTSSAAATGQNGSAAGVLTSVSIGSDGTINGVFTNGQTLALAQLAVANFANPQGLSLQGNNYYAGTTNSGPAVVGAAGSGGLGTVQQGELEESNVDVSLEFTQLIVAQRGFEANAKALTVADQVLQTLDQVIQG
jgi:flagellar hook protein FlgE